MKKKSASHSAFLNATTDLVNDSFPCLRAESGPAPSAPTGDGLPSGRSWIYEMGSVLSGSVLALTDWMYGKALRLTSVAAVLGIAVLGGAEAQVQVNVTQEHNNPSRNGVYIDAAFTQSAAAKL